MLRRLLVLSFVLALLAGCSGQTPVSVPSPTAVPTPAGTPTPVLATGRLAVEVEAFVQAAQAHGYGSLWATVNGWLRSQNGSAVVVADRIMFLVDGEVRQKAASRVREILRGNGASGTDIRRPVRGPP